MIELFLEKKLQAASGVMMLEVNSTIESQKMVTLYGASGAGKTSVLRMLAGLLTPDAGRIVINGTTWFDKNKGINLPPQKRKVGFLFQNYALFPNMTVAGNLEFALEKGQAGSIVDELIAMMELGALRNRKPTTLSGGQQQRVALARALVQRPELLLLDEPLSALDHTIRKKLQDYILRMHKEYGLTTILVSHDLDEILKMSDEVIHLENGKVINQGTATNILKSTNQISLTGKILAIEELESIFITIGIGDDQAKIVVDKAQLASLKIGDNITITSSFVNTHIEKHS